MSGDSQDCLDKRITQSNCFLCFFPQATHLLQHRELKPPWGPRSNNLYRAPRSSLCAVMTEDGDNLHSPAIREQVITPARSHAGSWMAKRDPAPQSHSSSRQPRTASALSRGGWRQSKSQVRRRRCSPSSRRGSLPKDSSSICSAVSLTPVTTTKAAARFRDEVEKEGGGKKKKNQFGWF